MSRNFPNANAQANLLTVVGGVQRLYERLAATTTSVPDMQVLCEELSFVSDTHAAPASPGPNPDSHPSVVDLIADRNHHHRLGSWCLRRPDVVTNFHITEA